MAKRKDCNARLMCCWSGCKCGDCEWCEPDEQAAYYVRRLDAWLCPKCYYAYQLRRLRYPAPAQAREMGES